MFQNNRNKQTPRNSSKFVKISTFLIPQTKSSVFFGYFDTSPEHQNKPKNNEKKNFGFAKKQIEKQPKQIEFWFVSVRTEKKINGFEDPLIENVFWRFFWFVSVCFEKILFVLVVLIPVRNTETNWNKPKKMFFGFAKQTEKQPKQIEFRFVSVRTENKIWLFWGHPSSNTNTATTPEVQGGNVSWAFLPGMYDHVLQDEYKQGFTAALLHGLFNWSTVLVLLPLEVTKFLLQSFTLVLRRYHGIKNY